MGPAWSLRTFSPLPAKVPLDLVSFRPWQTQLSISTARPGGFSGATVGMAEMPESTAAGWPYLPQPVYVQELSHCEIWCGAMLLFEGRVAETDTTGPRVTGLRIDGYSLDALNDQPWYPYTNSEDSTYYTSGRLLLQAMADTIGKVVPPMQSIDFVDPGIRHLFSEVNGKTPAQLAQQFSTEGSGGALFDFMMWGGRRSQFLPRVAPALPAYLEDVDGGVQIQKVDSDLVGSVYVRYSDPVTGRSDQIAGPYTDPTFSTRYGGLSRAKEINGGTLTATTAAAVGETYLAVYSQPQYKVQIKRDGWRGLRFPSGAFRSPWFVNASEWIKIATLPMLPIIRTDVNATAGQMTLQVGAPPNNQNEMIRQLQTVSRAVTQGLNPTTFATNAA